MERVRCSRTWCNDGEEFSSIVIFFAATGRAEFF